MQKIKEHRQYLGSKARYLRLQVLRELSQCKETGNTHTGHIVCNAALDDVEHNFQILGANGLGAALSNDSDAEECSTSSQWIWVLQSWLQQLQQWWNHLLRWHINGQQIQRRWSGCHGAVAVLAGEELLYRTRNTDWLLIITEMKDSRF